MKKQTKTIFLKNLIVKKPRYINLRDKTDIDEFVIKKYVPIHIYDSLMMELELNGISVVNIRKAVIKKDEKTN